MSPVTGPFEKVLELRDPPRPSGFQPTNFYMKQVSSRQRPPFDLPLPYTKIVYQLAQSQFWNDVDPVAASNDYFPLDQMTVVADADEVRIAREKAYAKLVGRVSDESQWANNLLEARKGVEGMANAIVKLVKFTRKINRFDFVGAGRVLNMHIPNRKRWSQRAGDNWLAYHFGIAPLCEDIYNGAKALSQDFSAIRVSGSGSSRKQTIIQSANTGDVILDRDIVTIITKCRQGCAIRIVNPNASLMNNLGLTNPVAFVWEAIPFSFVADWFGTVGDVISSATDFLGMDVSHAYNSVLSTATRNYFSEHYASGAHPKRVGRVGVFNGAVMLRGSGLVGPELHFKPFKGFSTTRGATAIALLNAILPGQKYTRSRTY